MGILTDLETLIDDANNTLDDLNGLIGQLQEQYPPPWCYTWDFTQSNGGWALLSGTTAGAWVSGQGWTMGDGTVNSVALTGVYIRFPIPNDAIITEVGFEYTGGGGSQNLTGILMPASAPHDVVSRIGGALTRNPKVHSVSTTSENPYSPTDIRLELTGSEGSLSSASGAITRCTMRGVGTNPFGTSNCT